MLPTFGDEGEMVVLPAVCERCGLSRLCAIEDAQRGDVVCAACGARCRVIPGATFAAKDAEFFDELSHAVLAARLAAAEALTFEAQLHQAILTGSYTRIFDLLSQRMPHLIASHTAIGKNPVAQRRALLMLKVIIEGTLGASNREASGS